MRQTRLWPLLSPPTPPKPKGGPSRTQVPVRGQEGSGLRGDNGPSHHRAQQHLPGPCVKGFFLPRQPWGHHFLSPPSPQLPFLCPQSGPKSPRTCSGNQGPPFMSSRLAPRQIPLSLPDCRPKQARDSSVPPAVTAQSRDNEVRAAGRPSWGPSDPLLSRTPLGESVGRAVRGDMPWHTRV